MYPRGYVAKYEFAAVSVPVSGAIEQIVDKQAQPYTGTFVEANTQPNEVVLTASLPNNEAIGLWIKRIAQPKTAVACDALEATLSGESKTETVDFVLTWD